MKLLINRVLGLNSGFANQAFVQNSSSLLMYTEEDHHQQSAHPSTAPEDQPVPSVEASEHSELQIPAETSAVAYYEAVTGTKARSWAGGGHYLLEEAEQLKEQAR